MISSCDYRVRYVQHGKVDDPDSSEEADTGDPHSGFRLWSSGPNFDTDLPQDVTGVVGHTAYLTCRVFDRTNSTVSFFLIHIFQSFQNIDFLKLYKFWMLKRRN